jgi:hypothetical protein
VRQALRAGPGIVTRFTWRRSIMSAFVRTRSRLHPG